MPEGRGAGGTRCGARGDQGVAAARGRGLLRRRERAEGGFGESRHFGAKFGVTLGGAEGLRGKGSGGLRGRGRG